MEVRTFDEILTDLCDNFDSLISPKTIKRSNTNIIYLLFKAFAKGIEVINNLCVSLTSKFDPSSCSDEDLESVAKLVGTSIRQGSESGLLVVFTNNAGDDVVLQAGTYTYAFNSDVNFTADIYNDVTIPALGSHQELFMSDVIGKYSVSQQTSISVDAERDGASVDIDEHISIGCLDNTSLIGTNDETLLEFRKRLLSASTRSYTADSLQEQLLALPYVFDVKVFINNDITPITIGGKTVDGFNMLIVLSGQKKNEIAKIVSGYGVYPTYHDENSTKVVMQSSVFKGGEYAVWLNDFSTEEYSVKIKYSAASEFVSKESIEAQMRTGLFTLMNKNVHSDYVTEKSLYDALESLNINGVTYLSLVMYSGSEIDEENRINYLSVPVTNIPELVKIEFEE